MFPVCARWRGAFGETGGQSDAVAGSSGLEEAGIRLSAEQSTRNEI